MKKITATLAAIIFAVSLSACGSAEEDSDIDSGVVIKSGKGSVTVLEDDNETDKHKVSKTTARKCSVGKRWPDCK